MRRLRRRSPVSRRNAAGVAIGALLVSVAAVVTAPFVSPALGDVGPLAATPLDAQVFAGGTEWDFTNDCGTDNGLPTGGVQNGSSGFSLNDVTTTTASDAFDCGAMVWVGTTAVADDDGTVDVTASGGDEVLTLSTQAVGGLQVTDTYRMFANGDTARVLVELDNPTAAPISTPVAYVSNFGSDAATVVAGTSSGDTAYTTADRWLVTSDDPTAGTDLIDTGVFAGPGAAALPTSVSTTVFASSTTDGALATFDVTVPAGEKRYLMFFQVVTGGQNGTPNAAAVASAAVWNTTPAPGSPLLAGIPPADLGLIVNWSVATAPPPTTSGPIPPAGPAVPAAVVPTFTG